MTDDPRISGFTDDDVKRVLERAIELDAMAKNRVSERELRAIAEEIGVSAKSLEVAIRESTAPESPAAPVHADTARTPGLSIAGFLIGGGVAGALFMQLAYRFLHVAHYTADPEVLGLAGATLAGASAMAALRARNRDQVQFHATNMLLWLGAYIGAWISDPVTTSSDPVYTVMTILIAEGFIASSVIGIIVGAMQWRPRLVMSRDSAPPPSDDTGTTSSGGSATSARKWRDWMHRLFPWFENISLGTRGVPT